MKKAKTELDYGLTVTVPLEHVDPAKLLKLLEAKGSLIRKALGADTTGIVVSENGVEFPWFNTMPAPEEARAYTNFIAKLCAMTKEATRVNATEKAVDNEKYAFRCFLLRLGFIGAEYKTDRKILLKNLEGSLAFKSGDRKKEADACE